MTPQEFDYIKRAVEALESGECTAMTEVKILRTVSQITERGAQKLERAYLDQVEGFLDQERV
jgi:hypothetical protein